MAERTTTRKAGSGRASSSTRSTGKSKRPASASNGKTRKSAGKTVTPEGRWKMIAEAAFFRAEQRGFEPGGEIADWLAAEMEVDALLMGKSRKSAKQA